MSDIYDFINTGVASNRPGGDAINIQSTSGKKSTKNLLEEIALAKSIQDLQMLPETMQRDRQRHLWEAEDQRWKAEDQKNQAEQFQLTKEQFKTAQAAAGRAAMRDMFELQEARKNAPLERKAKQQQLWAGKFANDRKLEAYNRAKRDERNEEIARYKKANEWRNFEKQELPEHVRRNAQQNLQNGMDPVSAYTNAWITGSRNPTMPYKGREREQYINISARNRSLPSRNGGPSGAQLEDAYKRLINRSGPYRAY